MIYKLLGETGGIFLSSGNTVVFGQEREQISSEGWNWLEFERLLRVSQSFRDFGTFQNLVQCQFLAGGCAVRETKPHAEQCMVSKALRFSSANRQWRKRNIHLIIVQNDTPDFFLLPVSASSSVTSVS